MNVTALIPAYKPSSQLVELVREIAVSDFAAIIVVNDGSPRECDPFFREIEPLEKVTILRHTINLGKGAAIKTGLNHAYCCCADNTGIVVVDADGQHPVEDALKVARALENHPESLVIGARTFDRRVPLRSWIGNTVTRHLFYLITGNKLKDTQSGLRGIPRDFIPMLLRINANGYEFELDMLLACKYDGRPIEEQQVRTVYIDGNKSSHFNPIVDSMKIYFVLFRFTLTSLLSALIDNIVFILIYRVAAGIFISQAAARVLATTFNYLAVKKIVFYSDRSNAKTLPKYLLLVLVSGFVSYLLINVLTSVLSISVIAAKVSAESLIFLANFAIQRDFIFVGKGKKPCADEAVP